MESDRGQSGQQKQKQQLSAEDKALPPPPPKKKGRRGADPANQKRRCVSTACIACRKRKSKCDGALPSCAACSSVYGTECVYDPNSDHRRKGVYREKIDSTKARNSTLQILVEAILNADEEDVPAIVKRIRTCDSLDAVAESIIKNEFPHGGGDGGDDEDDEEDEENQVDDDGYATNLPVEGERDLARKMGELRLENGSVRFIGGTSHLIYLGDPSDVPDEPESDSFLSAEDPIISWSEVTKDTQLVIHLINMYFNWHYPYFTTLSKNLFYRDFLRGKPTGQPRVTVYCSSLLVNAMLSLGCHFTSVPGAFAIPGDSRTKGDHFFAEAKRLITENDEYEKPRLTTVQALALMSVREAGCGREAKGWVYSGMSFRMAQDIGLNLDIGGFAKDKDALSEQEIDARRITFWGCFLFDKCWSNYLGRLPQLPKNTYNVPKFDVFPDEDAETWSPYTDAGFDQSFKQPSRIRAVGLQLSKLCEVSSDLLLFFYHPNHIGRSSGKSVELKKLSELHRRLEDWKKELPKEFEAKEGQLPNVILMHMFYHLQYIHLFRPFLKYTPAASPLPAHVSPRRICTANAGAISKLMRLYKKTYNLRQICNIAVYMVHSACTIHMLNLPEKTAKRDVIHGVKHLEEIAEDWLCARRTLSILSVLARKWNVEMPEEAAVVLQRTDEKYGTFSTSDVPSPPNRSALSATPASPSQPQMGMQQHHSSPLNLGQEQQQHYSSPLSQYSQLTPPSMPADMDIPPGSTTTTTTISPEMLNSLAMVGAVAPQQQQNMQDVRNQMVNSMPGGGGYSAWAAMAPTAPLQQQQHQQRQRQHQHHRAMPSYSSSSNTQQQQSFTPVHSNMPSGATSRTGTRHVSPTSIYAIDGQDWYLKDGVNWQQNFEAWGLGAAGAVPTSHPGGGGDMVGDAASMYMFRGLGGGGSRNTAGGGGGVGNDNGGLDFVGFESLHSMGSLDHLPGLD
ncbi:fungal-specific transcription factor domain-containing protein [Bombardia bombarda]|uniref:Fungal-specific transcription factor domain-containing protein n=1 Tax=Bombardia bombarda TaxID=252184 RepID=A0AA39XNG9_9PEZI|nr:fungal-specific transcription factor domain-containing protein [Bombardia bombarda]